MSFTFENTKLPGVVIIHPQVFGDQRDGMVASFKEAQAAGEDTCLCPACQAGKALLGMKEEILD